MSTATPPVRPGIVYPETDGQPMAENTLQYRWIVTIREGLGELFMDRLDVFVAADLLWYPVEGHPEIRTAPDVMVVLGRPKGDRGSYMQWEEEGLAPQVVFEILSPGNRPQEMIRKFQFYERYGVREYIVYDPDWNNLDAWVRQDGALVEINPTDGWTSPLLGIRFDLSSSHELVIWRPDGRRFFTYEEMARAREAERQRAEAERQRAEEADQRAEAERQRAETERQRADRLAEQLRELGIKPKV